MKLANSSPPSSSESSPSSVASNNPILPLPLSTRPVPEWAKMSAILPMVHHVARRLRCQIEDGRQRRLDSIVAPVRGAPEARPLGADERPRDHPPDAVG